MDYEKEIQQLKDEIKALKDRRIEQMYILPGVVKTRHMGEPNKFVVSGTDRPTTGETTTGGVHLYFDTSTGVLSIWDGTQWLETTLS